MRQNTGLSVFGELQGFLIALRAQMENIGVTGIGSFLKEGFGFRELTQQISTHTGIL
jgi:hypothetical protein